MRHFISLITALFLLTPFCAVVGNCVYASSSAGAGIERCDTVVISYHPKGGQFSTEDREDFPPLYVTVDFGEIVDSAYFSILKCLVDSFSKTKYDILLVTDQTEDWNFLQREKASSMKQNRTKLERIKVLLSRDKSIRDDSTLNYLDWDHMIEVGPISMKLIHNPEAYAMVMLDSIPLLISKKHGLNIYKPVGKITYKYTSNYRKFVYDAGFLAIEDYPISYWFGERNGTITKIGTGHKAMEIICE